MWERLVAERGGTIRASMDGGPADAGFGAILARGDGALPLLARIAAGRYLLKEGRVGGAVSEPGALEITPVAAAAALDAALGEAADWERDPDTGLDLLVSDVPGVAQELLIPRFLYRRADRVYEYAAQVPALRECVGELTGMAPPRAVTAE